jgi:DNA-binding transcriptional MerR regulator
MTLPQIAAVAEVEYRTLHTWLRRGLIAPSVQASTGSGTRNLFSDRDALAARVLADLRRAGLDLDALARTAEILNDRREELRPDHVLVVNGTVTIRNDEEQLAAALARPEPAIAYRISWAIEALEASDPP